MVQAKVVIFTLESVISTTINVSGFLQSCRGLLTEKQESHCEITAVLAFYMQLYQDYKHESVTSQIMVSIHTEQFKLKQTSKQATKKTNWKAVSLIRQVSQPERSAILILGEQLYTASPATIKTRYVK